MDPPPPPQEICFRESINSPVSCTALISLQECYKIHCNNKLSNYFTDVEVLLWRYATQLAFVTRVALIYFDRP
jgi:hypothetical protein